MKKGENVDGKLNYSLPSMKKGENVDGRRGLWMRGWGMDRKCKKRLQNRGKKRPTKMVSLE